MKVVERIKVPIYQEMELFEEKFTQSMFSNVALLNRITHFIVNRKGKQMRPMFVFLVAKLVGNGKVNERTYRGASVIELIHTATLVHDDVVDDSNKRPKKTIFVVLRKDGDKEFTESQMRSLDMVSKMVDFNGGRSFVFKQFRKESIEILANFLNEYSY